MNKIICDICGTTYPESAECCPICGCTRDAAANLLGEEILAEDTLEETAVKPGRFVPRKKKEIFDFDEVNSPPEDDDEDEEEEDEDDYDEEEDEDEPRPNTIAVILLTILIAALLIAAGFIFVRYFLPNMAAEETVSTTETTQAVQTTAVTEVAIPCEQMMMNNVSKAELSEAGQQFLLNILVKPENTTDQIVFTSGNESVATVSEDGRITAVSEGETIIYISCGDQSMECPVVVKYVEETVPPTTEAEVEETAAEGTTPDETEPESTAAAADPDVVLKLKKTDIQLGVYYYVTLELDCELEPTQVEWSSEHPHIAKVDENGVVTALKEGTTSITAKYGDQQVQCMVRCGWY